METEYRRDLQHSYLVLHREKTAEEQAYPLRMVTQNHIPGLLKCECRKIDAEELYYYDLTSKISLAEKCAARKVTGEEVFLVLNSLLQTMLNMEEYLLPADALYLKAEHIYVDAAWEEISFCYVPGESWNLEDEFREFMEGILPMLDHQKREETMAVYELYHYSVQEHFSMDGLRQQMEICQRKEKQRDSEAGEEGKLEQDPDETAEQRWKESEKDSFKEKEEHYMEKKRHEEALEAFFQDEEAEERGKIPVRMTLGTAGILLYLLCGWFLLRNFPDKLWIWGGCGFLAGAVAMVWNRKREQSYEKENERTDIQKRGGLEKWETENKTENVTGKIAEKRTETEPGDEEEQEYETQILEIRREQTVYILEEKYPEAGRRIALGEEEIQLIGHLKGAADVVLSPRTVSRIHARLRRNGDICYLCDLNSRNGTWVNGQQLLGEQEVEVKEGDEITFADAVYFFRKDGISVSDF